MLVLVSTIKHLVGMYHVRESLNNMNYQYLFLVTLFFGYYKYTIFFIIKPLLFNITNNYYSLLMATYKDATRAKKKGIEYSTRERTIDRCIGYNVVAVKEKNSRNFYTRNEQTITHTESYR